MHHRISLLAAVIALALTFGSGVAYAQDLVSANIPFKFIAAGTTHDPGEYQLRVSDDQMEMTLTPPKGAASPLLITTRLAASAGSASADRIVFDKTGDTYYLSEVWLGAQDGYLLHAEKGKHTHHVIPFHRKAK